MRITVTELNAPPSMYELSGACLDRNIEAEIAENLKGSYFATQDRYKSRYTRFLREFIEPAQQANRIVRSVTARTYAEDVIRPIVNEDDLRNINPAMMIPVLTYKPVYDLLVDKRVQGYGFDADGIKGEYEINHDLLDRGTLLIDDVSKTRCVTVTYLYKDAPEYTLEERMDIADTRDYIQKILDTTTLDPTDLDELRG